MNEAGEPVAVVEVAHEALLRQWDALERWLRAFAADLAAGEAVRRSAMHWQRGQRDEVLLVHTGHRLEAAEALLADKRLNGRFEPVDSQYLGACRERDQRVIQEREEQLRQVAEQRAKRAALQEAACAQMNPAARRITLEDRVLAPLISPDQLGRDVCEVAGIDVKQSSHRRATTPTFV